MTAIRDDKGQITRAPDTKVDHKQPKPEESFGAIIKTQHQQWLSNPTTQLFLQALESYDKSVLKCLMKDLNPESPVKSYHHGVALKTVADIRQIATNVEHFLARLNKPTNEE